jgi:hypothetical protein
MSHGCGVDEIIDVKMHACVFVTLNGCIVLKAHITPYTQAVSQCASNPSMCLHVTVCVCMYLLHHVLLIASLVTKWTMLLCVRTDWLLGWCCAWAGKEAERSDTARSELDSKCETGVNTDWLVIMCYIQGVSADTQGKHTMRCDFLTNQFV